MLIYVLFSLEFLSFIALDSTETASKTFKIGVYLNDITYPGYTLSLNLLCSFNIVVYLVQNLLSKPACAVSVWSKSKEVDGDEQL